MDRASRIIVDDADPRIRYLGAWITGGSMREHRFTTHGTFKAESYAVFTFNGSYVAVYGTVGLGRGATMSSYVLDSSSPVTFTSGPVPTTAYRQLFYHSPRLKNGQHTLVITKLDGGPLWLDYFHITPDTDDSPPSQSPQAVATSSLQRPRRTSSLSTDGDQVTTTTSSPTALVPSMTISATEVVSSEVPSSASVTETSLASPSQSPVATSSTAGVNSGALVGGLIGGVIFLLCIVAFVWFFYKRKVKAAADTKNSHGAPRLTAWGLSPQSAAPSMMLEAANFNPSRMVRLTSPFANYSDNLSRVNSPQYGYLSDDKPFR